MRAILKLTKSDVGDLILYEGKVWTVTKVFSGVITFEFKCYQDEMPAGENPQITQIGRSLLIDDLPSTWSQVVQLFIDGRRTHSFRLYQIDPLSPVSVDSQQDFNRVMIEMCGRLGNEMAQGSLYMVHDHDRVWREAVMPVFQASGLGMSYWMGVEREPRVGDRVFMDLHRSYLPGYLTASGITGLIYDKRDPKKEG